MNTITNADRMRKRRLIEQRRNKQRETHLRRLENLQNLGGNVPEFECPCCVKGGKIKIRGTKKPGEILFSDNTGSADGDGAEGLEWLGENDPEAVLRCFQGNRVGGKARVGDEKRAAARAATNPSRESALSRDKRLFLQTMSDKEFTRVCSDQWTLANTHNKENRYTKHHYCCRVCWAPGPREGSGDKALSKCSKCKAVYYCSVACQKKDYPSHKKWCYGRGSSLNMEQTPEGKIPWFRSYRRCTSCGCSHPLNSPCPHMISTSPHFGNLDLIVWPYPQSQEEVAVELKGDKDVGAVKKTMRAWGGENFIRFDEKDHESYRDHFKRVCEVDETKFLETHPESFRWSCCGMSHLEGRSGCFHHGSGPFRCQCSNCEKGIKTERESYGGYRCMKQSEVCLNITEGPDPRSAGRFGNWTLGEGFA